MQSMSGFGQAAHTIEGYTFQVEIKTVNHRYQEIAIRMPREWLRLEDAVKKLIQAKVKRGRIDVFITLERSASSAVDIQLNWALAEGYHHAAQQLSERLKLADDLSAKDLLAMPDIVSFQPADGASDEWLTEQLMACTNEALERLLAMRQAEGLHIHTDISQRLQLLEKHRQDILSMVPQAHEAYRLSLEQRMKDLLADQAIDEHRLLLEAALMADRTSIDEELVRLASHFSQCTQLLEEEGPVGRKLDFLIQEMNREVNTIGSKSTAVNFVNHIVAMKAELEKIREQVQNIE